MTKKVLDKELRIEEITNVMFVVSLIGSFFVDQQRQTCTRKLTFIRLTKNIMTKLTWHTEKRCVKDLLPLKTNPRKMSEKQVADLKKSLEKFDLVEIPAVDTDGKIVAGHQRVAVLQLLGRGGEMIDCRVPNRKLTKQEYEQYLITSNKVHGDWDIDLLRDNFEIDTLIESGFTGEEITDLFLPILDTV